ncbi:hypothetical protein PTTG_26360 [Puccinia triticina 1-1 BBBD Race 1]|uniref:Uncharacterized protein n=2 Tax=Puccinia triticina TaxID=208348 RepID=A0A180GVM5_PUCT1|nr:hypothetical protein PTTG_26360 [Puccinia triticina 1-1 BBBD Race 1]
MFSKNAFFSIGQNFYLILIILSIGGNLLHALHIQQPSKLHHTPRLHVRRELPEFRQALDFTNRKARSRKDQCGPIGCLECLSLRAISTKTRKHPNLTDEERRIPLHQPLPTAGLLIGGHELLNTKSKGLNSPATPKKLNGFRRIPLLPCSSKDGSDLHNDPLAQEITALPNQPAGTGTSIKSINKGENHLAQPVLPFPE